MTPQRKWIIICVVVVLCVWLLLDNLAIGSNFGRFVLSREWQSAPLTIIRLNTLYDYVETDDYLAGVHTPLTNLVESHGGRVPRVSAARFDELCNSRTDWQQVFVYEVDRGKDFSDLATSLRYRNLQSANASILRDSVEIAIQAEWDLDYQRSYLMLLMETQYADQADEVASVIASTLEEHKELEVVLAEKTLTLTGKKNFDPNLISVISFVDINDLDSWLGSVTTQSEMAILDGDLDQVQAFLLTSLN
ncbi:MAG: hypothetical protein F4X44_06355 [Gammaproteobacteria bacterium]|nr:hypothetical protein [Gammaproteobacteria bacterium]MYD80214.1 hypothetical protein [Gammaproteobacteria bacterium]